LIYFRKRNSDKTFAMISQSQAASQSDVDDQRFAELLKPIKDLTTNWEVPLADLLSTYIDDLQHVTITFDGGETSVNFAEAALLLQGTASVYSKKVEFLWQMVLQTLDMLRSKKETEGDGEAAEGEGPTQKGRRKNQVDMTREFGLLEADLGKNLDVKNEEESLAERKNALNFIYITPRQLIEKEGSEQKSVKVNLFMGVQSGKFDILAAKEDFRINSQYVSVTGGLGEDLTVDNRYLSVSVDDNNDDTIIPEESSETLTPFSPGIQQLQVVDAAPASPLSLPDNDGDISHTSIRAAGQHNESQGDNEFLASVHSPVPSFHSPAPGLDKTPEPVFDPWAPLDPYQVLSTPRPCKKGKTIRLPPSLREGKKSKTPKQLPPIEQYLVQEMTTSLYNPSMLPNVPPVFYDLAAAELLRRREREKEERMARLAKNPGARREVFSNNREDGQQEDVDDIFDQLENNDVPEEQCHDEVPDDFPVDDLPNPHLGGDIGSFVMEDLGPVDEVNEDDGDSYEDLVAKRVAEFVQKSQDFLKSSELTRRVAKWHEMIGPRLDKVEQRKAFDVHAYGSFVLNSFKESTVSNPNQNLVDFGKVVQGQKGEEVARFFLSTLMLANTENVKISTKAGTDPQLGMDNVQLLLLSTARHHEQLAEFEAASQADPGAAQDQVVEFAPAAHQAAEEGPYKAKKRPNKNKNESLDLEGSDSEEDFKVPEPPAKKKGKKNK